MSLVKFCILLLIAVVSVKSQERPVLGGWRDVDSNDSDVLEAANIAKQFLLTSDELCEEALDIISVQSQLVNGINYKFVYTADPSRCGGNGSVQNCEVKVYVSFDKSVKNVSRATCTL